MILGQVVLVRGERYVVVGQVDRIPRPELQRLPPYRCIRPP